MKNDINYNHIFIGSNVLAHLKSINSKNIMKLTKSIESNMKSCYEKKKEPMNYLVIKPEPLKLVEPDYERPYMGLINETENKIRMEKILKRKVKDNQKQIIRKLKKESRVIDNERQKAIDLINQKRKEEIKLNNQYLEQQNLEYKKMMSSNMRKRFKIKKKKNK